MTLIYLTNHDDNSFYKEKGTSLRKNKMNLVLPQA